MDVHSVVKEIKQSFRLLMNGVTADSMRKKGMNYQLNWGVSMGDLRQMSYNYPQNLEVATALWNENVRECRLIATMLIPLEELTSDIVDEWIKRIETQELAETFSFNVLQHADFAYNYSLNLLLKDSILLQMCGFHTLSRLFIKNVMPTQSDVNIIIDKANTCLQQSESLGLMKSANACLQRLYALLRDNITDKSWVKVDNQTVEDVIKKLEEMF